jgi:hypothetical protein
MILPKMDSNQRPRLYKPHSKPFGYGSRVGGEIKKAHKHSKG